MAETGQVNEDAPAKIPLVFYRTDTANEPVRAWLKALDREDRLAVGLDLQRVQHRWPVGMPLCRSLGGGLWEVRTSLPSRTIARVFVCFHDGRLYALHAIIKKAQQTPNEALLLARKRMKDVEHG